MNYLIRPTLIMFLTAAVCVAALSLVYSITLEPIRVAAAALANATMAEVLPEATDFRELEADLPANVNAIYEGSSNGNVVGYVVESWANGYGGALTLMVGISSEDSAITGMSVLNHSESPGFSDPLNTERFNGQFEGLAVTVPVTLIKGGALAANNEIDAMTGATISTTAVVDAVNHALNWYQGGSGR